MRFTIALALSFATTALHAAGAGALAVRQQCTVDCACLDQNRNRFWEATERCCRPNGGEPDTPVWPNHLQFLRFARVEGQMLICLKISSLANTAATSHLKQPRRDLAAAAVVVCLNVASRFVLSGLEKLQVPQPPVSTSAFFCLICGKGRSLAESLLGFVVAVFVLQILHSI
ncbi:hypothetical protein B0T25DRAFT_358306 [Lasiosphaeria hispida]|uniref:Extracellular membrane protein CFEM domain-containing protein n=1 Tax=Lasiosphaeria hispida TaxID=260671 RepID=A0AAJ0M8R6_9PEZI|nr:hypothetical protein B0T25DRAFT_358306 [Lasiosphaeria hispida]